MDQKLAPTLIFTSKNVNENALKIWKSFNIEYQFIPITNEGYSCTHIFTNIQKIKKDY